MHMRSKLFIAVAASALLAACGGGGSDGGSDGTGGSAPPETARLNCHVTDSSTGRAVAEASVNFQAGSKEYTTQTNAEGNCRIDMPAVEVAGVPYPAATVTKTGYEPQTVLCEVLKAGRSCDRNVSLIPLAANMSIPVGGDKVMHLGDDVFAGAANSRFQKATDGAQLVFPIADWAAQTKAPGITKATVYLDAKGWQSDICLNRIGLSNGVDAVMVKGGVSPADGSWAGGKQVPFVFNVDQIGRQRGELVLQAGGCNGTNELDDFEVNRIRVEFN